MGNRKGGRTDTFKPLAMAELFDAIGETMAAHIAKRTVFV